MYLDVYGDTLCAFVSAAALSSTGHQVRLRLPQGAPLMALEQGGFPYREPGLAELMEEQQEEGRLRWERCQGPTSEQCDVVWLALSPDSVEQAQQICAHLPRKPDRRWLVVNQSTFPVGTSDALQSKLRQNVGEAAAVVSLPDLLPEGAALATFTRADHWLVGSDTDWASDWVAELLRPFNRRLDHTLLMTPREAEFTKLAITGMLATRLSYMNDLANLADQLSVDIERVRQGMGTDSRIGDAYLYPGCGFGGQSFSRDLVNLVTTLAHGGQNARLVNEVLAINERQKEVLFRKLWRHYDNDLIGRRVTLWGAAFKPDTARIDNGPALSLLTALWAQGATVHVHDPQALSTLRQWAGDRADLKLFDDPYKAAEGSDALLLVTEWKSYWSPDFPRLKQSMNEPLLLDGRNIWEPAVVREYGFDYYGIGRQ